MNYLLVVFLIILLLALVHTIRERKLLEEEKNQLKRIIDDGNYLYQQVADENRSLRHIKHDYKKQQQVVSRAEEAAAWNEISGNKIIDVILDIKRLEANKKNIDFSLTVDKSLRWSLQEDKTISLFTNLMDNAIEAASKVDGLRHISIDVKQVEDKVRIKIKNSKLNSEKPLENNMTTTKDDQENHGYGINIIKDIVYENNGIIHMTDNENEFATEILI